MKELVKEIIDVFNSIKVEDLARFILNHNVSGKITLYFTDKKGQLHVVHFDLAPLFEEYRSRIYNIYMTEDLQTFWSECEEFKRKIVESVIESLSGFQENS